MSRPSSFHRLNSFVAALVWLCATGAGLGVLYEYQASPGTLAAAPTVWPVATRIQKAQEHPTFIVFAHPHCPCTQASLSELGLLVTRLRDQISTYVVLVRPDGLEESAPDTDLWRTAKAIPGVQVVEDEGGVEAARFGAVVSGQSMLFDREGQLLFNGGITIARGHAGESPGRAAIVSLVTTGKSARNAAPVFGCILHDPDAMSLQTEPSWKKSTEKNR